jgi:LmbE family N-acetylglucosaminyl deacetylase
MVSLSNDRHIGPAARVGETEWRRWLACLPMPPLEVEASARLVVVAPHPDDEVLACGGLIAHHAARGGEVTVIAVTDGEASHSGDASWPPEQLAAARHAERLAGLACLGVAAESVHILQLPDGRITAHRSTLADHLNTALRPGDVVVSTWAFDGHPDHDATGAEVRQAGAQRGCSVIAAPVWMWHWSAPDDPRVPWQRLRGLRLSPAQRQVKRTALACHVTQLAPRAQGLGPVLDAAILARAERTQEVYLV